MAKHPKQKQGGAQKNGGKRVEPYAKKAKVEVTFEGDQPVKTSSNGPNQSTSKPAKSAVQPKQFSEPASKGKGKEKASQSTAAEVEEEQVSGSTFVVVAGSYEKLLYGLEGSYTPGSTKPTLKPIFIFPAHLACVKAVSGSPGGKWLATGSEDEFVKVWDLRRRKEVGSLSQHTGSITSLHFPTPSHLITTSEDSTMSLFRTSDWALLKSLKGHSGRVNHVDVHPTGRVALSVGKDKTLKMWDLMRGRGAASLALGTEAELVKFSPLGTHFAVLYPKKVEIYSLTLKLLETITGAARFNALAFSLLPVDEDEEDKEVLCVGTEKGKVEVYTVELSQDAAEEDEEDDDEKDEGEKEESGAVLTKIGTLVGATNRIKAISVLAHTTPSSSLHPAQRLILLSSVSSDGHIRLYELTAVANNASETQEVEPIASYDTKGSRLTVCHITDGRKLSALTKMADVAEEGSDEDDDEDEADEDMYDNDDDEEEDDEGGMEVEMEGEEEDEEEAEEEEEEEEEDEGEYE